MSDQHNSGQNPGLDELVQRIKAISDPAANPRPVAQPSSQPLSQRDPRAQFSGGPPPAQNEPVSNGQVSNGYRPNLPSPDSAQRNIPLSNGWPESPYPAYEDVRIAPLPVPPRMAQPGYRTNYPASQPSGPPAAHPVPNSYPATPPQYFQNQPPASQLDQNQPPANSSYGAEQIPNQNGQVFSPYPDYSQPTQQAGPRQAFANPIPLDPYLNPQQTRAQSDSVVHHQPKRTPSTQPPESAAGYNQGYPYAEPPGANGTASYLPPHPGLSHPGSSQPGSSQTISSQGSNPGPAYISRESYSSPFNPTNATPQPVQSSGAESSTVFSQDSSYATPTYAPDFNAGPDREFNSARPPAAAPDSGSNTQPPIPQGPGAAAADPLRQATQEFTPLPSSLQRAVNAVRSAIPLVQRLLPLLDGNFTTAVNSLVASQNPTQTPAQPSHPAPMQQVRVDLEPIERGLAEVKSGHIELRTQVLEQITTFKRVEDQLERVREATDRNTLEQQELVEDLRSVGSRVSTFAIIGLVLLVVILGANIFFLIQLQHILR